MEFLEKDVMCPMAELVTASDCYAIVTSEGREFEPHWGSTIFFFWLGLAWKLVDGVDGVGVHLSLESLETFYEHSNVVLFH